MLKAKKKFYIPDIYWTAVLILLGIVVIALLANLFLPWVTALSAFLKK